MIGFVVRDGSEADVEALLDIERRAARLLLDLGGNDVFAMHATGADDLVRGARAGSLKVAERAGQPIGFALAGEVDAQAHLFALDVLPEWGRQGIGSALLESVCEAASARGCASITLLTLRDVPWNAPFYAKRGFVEAGEASWSGQLRDLIERERRLGLPSGLRVAMRRAL